MKDEHQDFLTKFADFLYDEEDCEEDALSPEEEVRAQGFVAAIKARIAKDAESQRLNWVREAEASMASAMSQIERAKVAQPGRASMLSTLRDSPLLAARGMERGLDQMNDDELFALYESQKQAQILDEFE